MPNLVYFEGSPYGHQGEFLHALNKLWLPHVVDCFGIVSMSHDQWFWRRSRKCENMVRVNIYRTNVEGATNTLEAQAGKVTNIHTINEFDINAFIRVIMVATRVCEALGSSYY